MLKNLGCLEQIRRPRKSRTRVSSIQFRSECKIIISSYSLIHIDPYNYKEFIDPSLTQFLSVFEVRNSFVLVLRNIFAGFLRNPIEFSSIAEINNGTCIVFYFKIFLIPKIHILRFHIPSITFLCRPTYSKSENVAN